MYLIFIQYFFPLPTFVLLACVHVIVFTIHYWNYMIPHMIVWNMEWIYRMVILFYPSGSSQQLFIQVENWVYLHIYWIFWFSSSHSLKNNNLLLLLLVDWNQWIWNGIHFKLNWLLRWTLIIFKLRYIDRIVSECLGILLSGSFHSILLSSYTIIFFTANGQFFLSLIFFLSSYKMTITRLFVLTIIMFQFWKIND